MRNSKRLTIEQKRRRMILFGCVDSKEFELAYKILDKAFSNKKIYTNKKKEDECAK